MVAVQSNMMPLGTKAPSFTLPDTISGNKISLDDIKSDKATVVMFICNHCPYVLLLKEAIVAMAKEFQSKGVEFVAISSNNVEKYPDDSPEKMTEFAAAEGFTFPYLYDESQDVARAYQAACTPDFFIFNNNMECVYRGRFDNATPGNGNPVTGDELRSALEGALEGKIIEEQNPSIGCNIKWKE